MPLFFWKNKIPWTVRKQETHSITGSELVTQNLVRLVNHWRAFRACAGAHGGPCSPDCIWRWWSQYPNEGGGNVWFQTVSWRCSNLSGPMTSILHPPGDRVFLATCIKSGAILQPRAFFQRQNPPKNQSKSVGQGCCFEPLFRLPGAGSRPSDKICHYSSRTKIKTHFQATYFKEISPRRPADLSDSSIAVNKRSPPPSMGYWDNHPQIYC